MMGGMEMQIGRARPLCCFFWIVCCVIAAYVVFALDASVLSVTALVAAAAVTMFLILAMMIRPHRFRLLYLSFLSLGLLVGTLASLCHASFVIRPANEYADKYRDDIILVEGLVTVREVESSYVNAYGVRTELSDGTQARVYLSVAGECDIDVGDMIRIEACVLPITESEEDEWYVRALRADGYTLAAYAAEPAHYAVLSHDHFVLREELSGIQRSLSDRLSRAIGGEEGVLVSALLLGTKKDLSDASTLDFRRAGASHLLALSGLHLSLIVLVIGVILRALRCPYLLKMILVTASAVVFLLFTGCSISTLRATVMLLYLYVGRLRGEPHDTLTSLSAFFGVCLILRPTWVYDAALWLSVLATLAVVEIVPALFNEKDDKTCRPWPLRFAWRYLALPILSTFVVMLVLIIPMALIFGEMSLASPVSNLLLTPLCAVLLVLGLITLALLGLVNILPLEAVLDLAIDASRLVARLMLDIATRLSEWKGVLLSLRYDFVPYLLGVLLVLLLVFFLFKWKRPHRFLGVAAAWVVVFASCFVATNAANRGDWHATYTMHGNSELLTLSSTDATVLCDMTDGSYTTYRELFIDGMPNDATEIDALVLTHYHQQHTASVYKLLGRCRVRAIWLPLTMPHAEGNKALKDESIARILAEMAGKRGCEVHYYMPNEPAAVTETLSIERLYYDMIKRSTHPTVAMRWSYRTEAEASGHCLMIVGASSWESGYVADILTDISAADTLVLAGHGPVIKSEYTVPLWVDEPDVVLFANGNMAKALTATPETMAAFEDTELILAKSPHTRFRLP